MNTHLFTLVARLHKTDRLRTKAIAHQPTLAWVVFCGSLALDGVEYSIRHLVQDKIGQI